MCMLFAKTIKDRAEKEKKKMIKRRSAFAQKMFVNWNTFIK